MKEKPKVSVIMGVYNTSDHAIIGSSINSILNQTYENFEFIICDDGSTDNSYDLIKKLTESDSRVILLKNEKNSGLAFTLNKCIHSSNGEYILRMDADDISLINRIERQVNFLDANPIFDLVGSSATLFDENGEWGFRCMKELPNVNDFLFGTPFIHPSILIRKSSLELLNGYRDCKETIRCEDYDLFMRLYSTGKKGYNIQEGLICYREDKESYGRRVFKFRLNEARVRLRGFRMLGLMPKGILYVVKPLVIGLIPQKILAILRNENKKSAF